jgi:hypothetical protein
MHLAGGGEEKGALPPLGAVRQFTPEVFLNQRSPERCAHIFSSSKILPPEAGRTVPRKATVDQGAA